MKSRSREINIFNLSMLDVLSGALGAFIIIMIVLFPYYRKEAIDYQTIIRDLRAQSEDTQRQADQAQAAIEQARSQAQQAQQRLDKLNQRLEQAQTQAQQARTEAEQAQAKAQQARQQAENLQRQLAKTFLVVYITWKTVDDVDLHVVDPAGYEFYFERKVFPSHPGELSEDNIHGPGAEVWEIHAAPPGAYRVFVNFYKRRRLGSNPKVRGRLFHRDGSQPLPTIRLAQQGRKKLLVTVNVEQDGSVTFQ